MAKRRRPTEQIEHDVLVACRRRCCLCYFLENDRRPRKGQLAHLDQNPSHSDAGNLVYLCFDHHDEYDSTTRQAKGLTQREVRTWRDRLVAEFEAQAPTNDAAFSEGVATGAVEKRHPWRHAWRFPMWLTADQPELFAYSAPAADGICAIERIDLPDGRIAISCIQVPGNPGNSITNCAEYVCAQVCERFEIDVTRLVWLENYEFFDRSEWKQIAFTIDDKGLPQKPVWTKMTAESWAALRLSPKARLTSTGGGDLRSKLKKHFPWPPRELILGLY